MADGIGLSIGATELAAVAVGRAAVRRSAILTLSDHHPPQVGDPGERAEERGLVLTGFVDRVGDPVPLVAADGSTHQGGALTADALRALLYTLTRGRQAVEPVGVTHPAHWAPGTVEALRGALARHPEFGATTLVSDAVAALTALQVDPGLPGHGVVALCDFGGTGTSVTLADAARGLQPIGPTVRHRELSGDLVDQALLTHVLGDLGPSEAGDATGTSAIGPLSRLREQCRGAKERLSTATVTSLAADLPGRGGEVRLTRSELDEVLGGPLAEFVAALRDTLERNGIRSGDLTAVATAGGGARIPLITTALSEEFRVPIITTAQPELAAAIGAGLTAARAGEDAADQTALAPVPVPPAEDPAQSSTFGALAWSAADDIPDVVPAAYDEPYPDPRAGPRPPVAFTADDRDAAAPGAPPWYRRPAVALGIAAVAVLAAIAAAVYVVRGDDRAPDATTTVTTPPPSSLPAPAPEPPPPADTPAPQAPETRTVTPPAPAPEEPPPPPSSEEPPPPTTTEPPPPATTEAPPTTTEAPPATTTRPRLIPTLPYTTIPGLPFVPAPPGLGGQ